MSTMLHVRMDDEVKAKAVAALDAIGLSASEAVRLLFHRIAADQAFPLELKVPNAETRAAMVEAEEIMAAHRKRWESNDEGEIGGYLAGDRQLEPKGPNPETLAAMREAEAIMAAHRRP